MDKGNTKKAACSNTESITYWARHAKEAVFDMNIVCRSASSGLIELGRYGIQGLDNVKASIWNGIEKCTALAFGIVSDSIRWTGFTGAEVFGRDKWRAFPALELPRLSCGQGRLAGYTLDV